MAETAGRAMMRMANADVLPFDVDSFYKTVADYVIELKALLDNTRTETEQENKMIGDKLFDIAKDPTINYQSPKMKDTVPYLNFSDLENAMLKLKGTAEEFQKQYNSTVQLPVDKQNELNEILFNLERSLLNKNGLPRRPWYKHQIYAPGYYTGYDVKTLPGIREAIEQRNWREAQENIEIVSKTIEIYTQQVQRAIKIISK
jgi:N-acetylated-alpha-linked acidic dipeptidase